MKIERVLADKEKRSVSSLVTISPDANVLEAGRLLCQHRIGALLVVDETDHLAGIVTERDVLSQFCTDHADCDKVPVKQIMTPDPVVTRPAERVEDALQVMTSRRIRHLPVVTEEEVAGIVSLGDLLRCLYTQDEIKIRYLSDYLGGTYGLKVY